MSDYKILQVKKSDYEKFLSLKAHEEIHKQTELYNFEFFNELLRVYEDGGL